METLREAIAMLDLLFKQDNCLLVIPAPAARCTLQRLLERSSAIKSLSLSSSSLSFSLSGSVGLSLLSVGLQLSLFASATLRCA